MLGLGLRLTGIHNPVLDHPAWRQGDTAAIARNFALLQFNIFYPQTDYNGPPPNYVELELQIVPYLAAIGYKLFGVHEIFGRLWSIAFSLGTVAVLAYFGRWLFGSALAGLAAALLYAIFPGSVYYGRTFTPEGTMAFFLTAALYAGTVRLLAPPSPRVPGPGDVGAVVLLALAFLAKPVALVAAVPLLAADYWNGHRDRSRFALRSLAIVLPALAALYLYQRFTASHAEWHWASGIVQKHVLPSLLHAFVSPSAMLAKLTILGTTVIQMLATTMLGPAGFALALLAFVVPLRSKADAMLYGWLGAVALYAFVVVTVERVDYYLYPVLPLAALAGGAFVARLWTAWAAGSQAVRTAALAAGGLALAIVIANNETQILPYYKYKHAVFVEAKRLNRVLAPGALVVMGHYDPSILYYINRKGWEEDPYLWTPFDEQSAIRKGARYLIAIEKNRLERNLELDAWMQRFPRLPGAGPWPVYETDPAKVLPGAEAAWQDFRRREKAGLLPKAGTRVPTTNGQLIDPTLPKPALTAPPQAP